MQLFQQFIVESRTHSSCIYERSIHPISELERAKMRATSLGFGETDDDKVPSALRFDLEPVSRSPASIPRRGFLGDDSLETHRRDLLEKRFAFGLDVIEVPQCAKLRHNLRQKLLATYERQGTQIEVFK